MKKVIAILLLVIFAAANSGSAVTFHYCKGKFSGVRVGSNMSNCRCRTKMPLNCCHSKTIVAKIKNNFLKNAPASKPPVQEVLTLAHVNFLDNLSADHKDPNLKFIFSNYYPPPYSKDHIVFYQVFRI
jgi:hypothetical protein